MSIEDFQRLIEQARSEANNPSFKVRRCPSRTPSWTMCCRRPYADALIAAGILPAVSNTPIRRDWPGRRYTQRCLPVQLRLYWPQASPPIARVGFSLPEGMLMPRLRRGGCTTSQRFVLVCDFL